ncbi:MAG: hypothetical protein IPM34_06875 [Saprospiraceae bacterium]|nr:hypothetical protein [Saprospiraceae bacterium]
MKKIGLVLLLCWCYVLQAQEFTSNLDLRFRFEQRHGYSQLIPDSVQGVGLILQRTRLNFDFKSHKLKVRIAPQNFRVWGDVLTNAKSDFGNAFHEAYGEVEFNETFALKLGRQEIVLDDHRIFGNVDWTMQGRSHDAALLLIKCDSNQHLKIGVAYNNSGESIFRTTYSLNQYKSMQFLWYHLDVQKKFGLSALFLNNGLAYPNFVNVEQKIEYSQTAGLRLNYGKGKFSADASLYWQFGKLYQRNLSASYYAVNVAFKPVSSLMIGAGIEYLSGKSTNDTSDESKSFSPLYGTNHKFNGHMDYFYVGNNFNSVGLTDLMMRIGYEANKFSMKLEPHYFLTAEDLGTLDKYLGTEVDFSMAYKLYSNVQLTGGFSVMLATETMEALRGKSKDNFNYWAWVGVHINPKLFSFSFDK